MRRNNQQDNLNFSLPAAISMQILACALGHECLLQNIYPNIIYHRLLAILTAK
jgi:hypothetical protein